MTRFQVCLNFGFYFNLRRYNQATATSAFAFSAPPPPSPAALAVRPAAYCDATSPTTFKPLVC
jgi:hypothetical protein